MTKKLDNEMENEKGFIAGFVAGHLGVVKEMRSLVDLEIQSIGNKRKWRAYQKHAREFIEWRDGLNEDNAIDYMRYGLPFDIQKVLLDTNLAVGAINVRKKREVRFSGDLWDILPPIIVVGLTVVMLAVVLPIILISQNTIEETKWNGGVCDECGSPYEYAGGVGSHSGMTFIYKCTECGHTIQTDNFHEIEVKH